MSRFQLSELSGCPLSKQCKFNYGLLQYSSISLWESLGKRQGIFMNQELGWMHKKRKKKKLSISPLLRKNPLSEATLKEE